MASSSVRFLSRRLRSQISSFHLLRPSAAAAPLRRPSSPLPPNLFTRCPSPSVPGAILLRHLSTASRRGPSSRSARPVDIGARARQLQNRRLWSYALTFSCIAGFFVIVLSNVEDQLVFYITPSDALEQFDANSSGKRFRLGGLVLEGSVVHPSSSSPEMEFVVTDLASDILVRYEGSLPDLFREGHSVIVEGFLCPFENKPPEAEAASTSRAGVPGVADKAKSIDCFFEATDMLAKHDEKYMPSEVAQALERNRKKIKAEAAAQAEAEKDAIDQKS